MKTFTYTYKDGGELKINDHNYIIEDIYFYEYIDNNTGDPVCEVEPFIKLKHGKYIQQNVNHLREMQKTTLKDGEFYKNESDSTDIANSYVKIISAFNDGYGYTPNQKINIDKINNFFNIQLNSPIDVFKTSTYTKYGSTYTSTYKYYHTIDIYGGDLNHNTKKLNNLFDADFQLIGSYDDINKIANIYGFCKFNNNIDKITLPITLINNYPPYISYNMYNDNSLVFRDNIYAYSDILRFDNRILFNNDLQHNLNNIKSMNSFEFRYQLSNIGIETLKYYTDINVYLIFNTQIKIIHPFCIHKNPANGSIELYFLHHCIRQLDTNQIIGDIDTKIDRTQQYQLFTQYTNFTTDMCQDYEFNNMLTAQVFSDEFLNRYDIREIDPSNYGWLNNIDYDKLSKDFSSYSYVNKNSLMIFKDINDNYSIKKFIEDAEDHNSISIFKQTFLDKLINHLSYKPLSFRDLYYIDSYDHDNPINKYSIAAQSNVNRLNDFTFQQLINEIKVEDYDSENIVSHFTIAYCDAARYISISPENNDKLFSDGDKALGLVNIKNTLITATQHIYAYYQFFGITRDRLIQFLKYFYITQSNVDFIVIFTHGCSLNMKGEYIYLSEDNYFKDNHFILTLQNISKNTIVFSFACFGAGLIDTQFNGFNTPIPINKTKHKNNIIFFYDDTASSSAITNTKAQLEAKLLCSVIESNSVFNKIITNYTSELKNIYDQLNTILIRFYYNLVNCINSNWHVIPNYEQYKTEIELNIIPKDLTETYGNLFRAEFDIFSTTYQSNPALVKFKPFNSLIQFMRFIFTAFSCDLSVANNIPCQDMLKSWRITYFMTEIDKDLTDIHFTDMLREFIHFYFGEHLIKEHEQYLISSIYDEVRNIVNLNKQFQKKFNIYQSDDSYLYFISDYRGVTYRIKDKSFLDKTWQNIIYG